MADTEGPFIVWEDGGCEGWSPKSYPTLKAALEGRRYTTDWIVTKIVAYEVTEVEDDSEAESSDTEADYGIAKLLADTRINRDPLPFWKNRHGQELSEQDQKQLRENIEQNNGLLAHLKNKD